MQQPFDECSGVVHTVVGYTGGESNTPTYEQVCSGTTGHVEAVQITFDPDVISYAQLLKIFWYSIDPYNPRGQFSDTGSQYRPIIFYHTQKQHTTAQQFLSQMQRPDTPPVGIALQPSWPFYPAEAYHQKFYLKNPQHYKRYAMSSGRAQYCAARHKESAQ
jgi:methionine-S-sulfoxide reductase